jgi:predicted phage terminase large subunit-like protein
MAAWAERLAFHELLEKVEQTCTQRRVDKLLVEAKNNGFSVAQEICRRQMDRLWSTELMPVKGDKLARTYSVEHMFSGKMVYAPDRAWADKVITQCEVFPKGKHDDLVDSTTQAMQYLRLTGLLMMRDERELDYQRTLMSVPRAGSLRPPYDI